jgi:hypothetical protein
LPRSARDTVDFTHRHVPDRTEANAHGARSRAFV